jgi:hypothetical protein
MKIKQVSISNKSLIVLLILVAGLIVLLIGVKANQRTEVDDKAPVYSQEALSDRYGEKIALKLKAGIVEYGYSADMVYHAKGLPYLIETPFGERMDFEIYYYQDMVVFMEFGLVMELKIIKKN